MRNTDLLKAMTDIDAGFIEEAVPSAFAKKEKKPFFVHWQAYAGAFAVILLAVILGRSIYTRPDNSQYDAAASAPQEVSTLQEAEDLTGFSFDVPESFNALSQTLYTVIDDSSIEVAYGDDYQLRLSKAEGTDDISGDYDTYESTPDIEIHAQTVHARMNGDMVYSAWWTDGSYSYSIYSKDGISEEQLNELVASMQ